MVVHGVVHNPFIRLYLWGGVGLSLGQGTFRFLWNNCGKKNTWFHLRLFSPGILEVRMVSAFLQGIQLSMARDTSTPATIKWTNIIYICYMYMCVNNNKERTYMYMWVVKVNIHNILSHIITCHTNTCHGMICNNMCGSKGFYYVSM